MTSRSSIPRRILLQLAGGGLAAAPLPAFAAPREGGAAAPEPRPAGEIWTEFFKGQRIWAYIDRHGIDPGESFNVMAAGGPGQSPRRVRLEVFRVGAAGPVPVWQSDFVSVGYRGATASGAAIGPGWPPSWTVTDTAGWAPGCYYADIVEQTTATRDVKAFFLIVTNPRRSGRVLCRLGTNTYQAYNPWGGHSLYPNGDDEARGLMVSFDRPTPPDFFEYDVFLVQWLEGLAGLGGVDYCSQLRRPPRSGDDRRLSPGRDQRPRRILERRRVQRLRTAHLPSSDATPSSSAPTPPTARCATATSTGRRPGTDQGRQLVCYKTASDPDRRSGWPTPICW